MTMLDRLRARLNRAPADGAPSPPGDGQPHDRATDPAGAVSNQNGEEAESGLRADATHPEPRTTDQPDEAERSSP